MTPGSTKFDDDRREAMLRFLDDTLPAEAVLEFNALLKADPAARRDFAGLLLQQLQLEVIGQEQKFPGVSAASPSKTIPSIVRFLPPWLAALFCGEPSALCRPTARRRNALAWSACAAVCLCITLYLFLPTEGTPIMANPEGGSLTLQRDGTSLFANGQVSLQAGDLIESGPSNGITIKYGKEPTTLHLDGGATVKILPQNRGKRLELRQGRLEASVAHQRPFSSMMITTPHAEARVLGTRFALTATTNGTRLEVTEGKVRFTRASDGLTVKVPAGNYAVAAADYELVAQPLCGRILREYWTNLSGDYYITLLTAHPNFPDHPNGREYLNSFEAPSHWGHNYGARIRGYLHPPRTGNYTFWIAAGDGAELLLSPDENPENRQQIAYANVTEAREWTKQRPQQSSPVTLVAGRKYYIEALHKQGQGDDHLAVAWQEPGGEREVVPGGFLSPAEAKK